MSMGKLQMQQCVSQLTQAVTNLVGGAALNPATGKSYTVGEAEVVVCQVTMDLYAWVLTAIGDSSPWPDPHLVESKPTPPVVTPPVPTAPVTPVVPAVTNLPVPSKAFFPH